MKKSIISILLVIAMLLSITACGTASESSAPESEVSKASSAESEVSAESTEPKEDVKLSIWVAGSGDPVYDQAYRTIFDAYTAEHSNVSYELTFIPWGEYFTKLNTGLVGGAGPDLFMLGYGQMGTVQQMGHLLELDSYIPQDWDGWDDFLPKVLDVNKKDGKMYAMFSPSTRVYLYRKDIAEQNGVTADELKVSTVEELHALGRKLTVKDDSGATVMSGLGVTTSQNSPEQQFMVEMTYQMDNPALWNDDLSPAFNTDGAVKGVESLYSLVKDGTSLISDPNVTTTGIVNGTASMALVSEATYREADAAFPGQIGVLDCDLNSLLIGNYMSVNKASKNPEVAADMLLHLFSKESCQIYAEGTGAYSGRMSLDADYVAINPEFEYVVKSFEKSIPYSTTMNPHFNKMVSILRTALEEIFVGADAQTRLDAAAEEYIAAMNE